LVLGNTSRAEELSRKALAIEPNPYNQSALAYVLLAKETPKDSQEAFDLASASVESLPSDEFGVMVLLFSAGGVNNMEAVRNADRQLLEVAPYNAFGHYYAGLIAADDGKWEKAESELLYSQKLGVPADAVQSVLSKGISRNALLIRSLRWGGIATGIWLAGMGLLYLVGSILSKVTMRAIGKTEPILNAQLKPAERIVRSFYRVVIAILSLYYYISLPFAILLLLVVVGGLYYVFFLIGTIPIQLAAILLIMLGGSLFAIVKAIFTRIREAPLGHPLRRIEAPELWMLVDDVARKLEVRPVDSIYVTPWAAISVNEKGGILRKMFGNGKRNLLLGMAALQGLTQGQLAAILAHEYGHFSNRDTAGGNLANQVNASLFQIGQQLRRSGAAVVFNPVWLVLAAYQRIFLRVTTGASRLQETLADRYAAIAYGSQNCIDGLKSMIRTTVAFPLQANREVQRMVTTKQPVVNLYQIPVETELQGELEKQLEEIMKRPTGQFDSHPAPQERFTLLERLHVPYSFAQDNPAPALHLFPNPEDLQRELTAEIMKGVRISK